MTVAVLLAALSFAGAAEESDFRWTRVVTAPGSGLVRVEPDGAMIAHARGGFRDLRIVDATGAQVPWRTLPPPAMGGAEPAAVLNSGRQGGAAVALLDLGPRRTVRDRVTLEIPDSGFVGRVFVSGADRRAGPFTRLSATGIYHVRGARDARSTTAAFPPTDFRFLRIRATGVSRIDGAIVIGASGRAPVVERRPRSTTTRQADGRTIVLLDFGHRNIPVDELLVTARTDRYDRRLLVEASNVPGAWRYATEARISRFEGSSAGPIALGTRARYLRLTIDNGDDPPLEGLRIRASSRSHALLLEGGHSPPYRLYYGAPALRPPDYEFARLPLDPASPSERGTLGPERRNPAFDLPDKPFGERHPWLLQLALALAAIAVGAAGFLAFRRRA